MAEDLLGAGLDIDGWNYLKQEHGRAVADLVDRSYVHRQMVPFLLRCVLPKELVSEAHEVVVSALESKSTLDSAWVAQKIKRGMDELFGASWHVVVGEDFTFNIDHEEDRLYYLLYGGHAIVAWKCGYAMPVDINHIDDPATKDKLKAMLQFKNEKTEEPNIRDLFFSDKI